MDSITQAALGAAVGHTAWGRQLGRPALAWGALFGTLPDLDIIAYPFLNAIEQLYWHRGVSHSVWFIVLGGLLLGWWLWKRRWHNHMTQRRALWGMLAIFATHVTIDVFTIYGTQLWAPFSRHGYSLGNLFIIDPLYTLPLLVGIVFAAISRTDRGWHAMRAGLVISTGYAVWSLGAHTYANTVFAQALQQQQITATKSKTMATPFNTLLWRHIAMADDAIYIGYYSLWAGGSDGITFERIPRQQALVQPYLNQANMQAIDWFSQGFWMAQQRGDAVVVSDLRFGELRFAVDAPPEQWQNIFSWQVNTDPNDLKRYAFAGGDNGAAMGVIWNRLLGR